MSTPYLIPDDITDIMIAHKNTKSIVRTDDGDTEFINISGEVLQGDILAPFLCLDYVLKSFDINNDIGFTLIKRRRKIYTAIIYNKLKMLSMRMI